MHHILLCAVRVYCVHTIMLLRDFAAKTWLTYSCAVKRSPTFSMETGMLKAYVS